jgi:hypothetical protein
MAAGCPVLQSYFGTNIISGDTTDAFVSRSDNPSIAVGFNPRKVSNPENGYVASATFLPPVAA